MRWRRVRTPRLRQRNEALDLRARERARPQQHRPIEAGDDIRERGCAPSVT
jgi:hypothetical protein